MLEKSSPIKFVYFLNIVNFLVILSAGFMIPLWGDFVIHIGGDVRTAGKAVAIFSMAIGFFTFFAGKIESKFSQDAWFMVATQAVRCLAYAGYFFVSSPMQLYGVQICLGVAGAFQAPAMYSLYHQHMPKKMPRFTGAFGLDFIIFRSEQALLLVLLSYTVLVFMLCLERYSVSPY
ncbi:MAG: hypothetical protein LRY69_06820 [Gammaproteobacteria bacterium]|nr:hypothetical protein [Gammaproteobacteria bacterium]